MKINIKGQRFGKLIAKEFLGYIDKCAWWKCKCDCGNEKNIRATHLRKGCVVSCGCFRLQRVSETFFKDLTGKRFERLVVINVGKHEKGRYFWKCKCDCGNVVTVDGAKLSFGHTKSCGCLCREINSVKMTALCKTQKGTSHPRWNRNITDDERQKRIERYRSEFRESKWRHKVYKRDQYICQKCGANKGGNLNSHHIYSWKNYKKLRYVVSNGITLCENCHKKFHKINGYGKNTRKQLTKYMRTM